jgi:hypothetical protein
MDGRNNGPEGVMKTIQIAGRAIGSGAPPYVIAEISANHNGRIETAMRLIEEAHHAGASAVKLQTYTPDTITLNSDAEEFRIQGGLWDGRTLYDLYQEAHMPWEWHKPLFAHARQTGITIFQLPLRCDCGRSAGGSECAGLQNRFVRSGGSAAYSVCGEHRQAYDYFDGYGGCGGNCRSH